jgi:hypothetical protein
LPAIPGKLVNLQSKQEESLEPAEFKVVPIEHLLISTLSEVFGDSRDEIFGDLGRSGVGITYPGVLFQSFLKMLVTQRNRFVRRVRLYKDDQRLIGIKIAFRNAVTGSDKEISFVRQNILIWHMFGPVEVEGPTEADSNYVAVQLQEAVRCVDELDTFELSRDVSGIAQPGSIPIAAILEVNNTAPKLQEIPIDINPLGVASWLMGLFQQRTGLEITENDRQTMQQFFNGQFPDVVSAIEKMESVPRKFKATLAILLIAGEAGLQNDFQSKRILISIDFLLTHRSDDSRTTAFVDMSKADRDSPLTIGQSWHLLHAMRDKYEKVLQVIRKAA